MGSNQLYACQYMHAYIYIYIFIYTHCFNLESNMLTRLKWATQGWPWTMYGGGTIRHISFCDNRVPQSLSCQQWPWSRVSPIEQSHGCSHSSAIPGIPGIPARLWPWKRQLPGLQRPGLRCSRVRGKLQPKLSIWKLRPDRLGVLDEFMELWTDACNWNQP